MNGTFYVNANIGTTGHLLTSGGAGASPNWQTLSTAYDNNIRFAVETNHCFFLALKVHLFNNLYAPA